MLFATLGTVLGLIHGLIRVSSVLILFQCGLGLLRAPRKNRHVVKRLYGVYRHVLSFSIYLK